MGDTIMAHRLRRRAEREHRRRTVEVAIRRARWIAIVGVVLHLATYSPTAGPAWPRWSVVLALVATLALANLVSVAVSADADLARYGALGRWMVAVDLVVGLALVALAAVDASSHAWPLLAVVIAEGAARAQLRGAIVTWVGAAVGVVTIELSRAVMTDVDTTLAVAAAIQAVLILLVLAATLGALTRELTGARERAADQAADMAALTALGHRLAVLRRVPAVTDAVLSATRDLTATRQVGLVVASSTGPELRASLPSPATVAPQTVPLVERVLSGEMLAVSDHAVAVALAWPTGQRGALVVCGLPEPLPTTSRDALVLLARTAEVALANAHHAEVEQRTIQDLHDLDTMKDDYIRMLSHDLRTPLTAVSGYAQLLEKRWDRLSDEHRNEFVTAVSRATDRMLEQVIEILGAARANRDLSVDCRRVDLTDVVSDPVAALRATSDRHDIEVVIEPAAAHVVADPARLTEVVENLLSNAVKYSPDGGAIVVTASRLADRVELAVTDHGIGLPATGRERLFQRFGRLEPDRGIPGHGIGLYVVRCLVERMGGQVTADNAEHGGAVFTVTLPAAEPAGLLAAS
jgi:signal transduction histidine kinase